MRVLALVVGVALTSSACANVVAKAIGVPGRLLAAEDIPAGTYVLDPEHAALLFKVRHLGFAHYWGRFDRFDARLEFDPARPEAARLDVQVEGASVNTQSATLNDMLRGPDWFDAEAHPEIRFASTRVVPQPERGAPMEGVPFRHARIEGTLLMNGVANPAELAIEYVGAGRNPLTGRFTLAFEGEAVIDRTRWDVDALVPAIGSEVTLLLAVELLLEPQGKADAGP